MELKSKTINGGKMATDRKYLGTKTAPYVGEVEKGQLRFFAEVTGQQNPIYFDEAAARAAGYPGLLAPPTFIFGFTFYSPRSLADLGVDMTRVLHAEQAFRHYAPIFAGDLITMIGEITAIYEKKSGALEFIVECISATNQAGLLCAELEVTTVITHG